MTGGGGCVQNAIKMLTPIPLPAVPGHVIGIVSTVDDKRFIVFWNETTKNTVFNYGRSWFISDDILIMTTVENLFRIPSNSLRIAHFQLLEHGQDITKDGDSADFTNCVWSDYCRDALCVNVVFDYGFSGGPVGGE